MSGAVREAIELGDFARLLARHSYTLKVRAAEGRWYGYLEGGPLSVKKIEFNADNISDVFLKLFRFLSDLDKRRPPATNKNL